MAIIFGLKAKNSSGEQSLHFSKGESGHGVDLTLVGVYRGEGVQIDFDALDDEDIDDLVLLLNRYRTNKLPPTRR
jgi:hypothetical protein